MSDYREFTGKSVEEALRNAREEFGVTGLDDLDFEILTAGSRGVLGMGAEPARIVAAPRSALGGSAPKREAAASRPLPPPPPREPREFDRDRGRGGDRGYDRGPRRDDRPPRRDDRSARDERRSFEAPAAEAAPDAGAWPAGGPPADRSPSSASAEPRHEPRAGSERGGRPDRGRGRAERRSGDGGRMSPVADGEAAELQPNRGSLAAERAELQAAEASPTALDAGKDILTELMAHMGYDVTVEVKAGETSRLNILGVGAEKENLGALIGRKGERLSALQHLVNLMLSKRIGEWTRVLVDVEDYRGRRERQLVDLANRAAERVAETGKMLQLEPMPALERRWIHLALRDHATVATQSIGEEPNRRVVVLPRPA